jgi:SAM-dependent methyltransferase
VIRALEGGGGRWCLDTTETELSSTNTIVDLRGWVAFEPGATDIVLPHLQTPAGRRPLRDVPRADVEALLPGYVVVGFTEVLALGALEASTGAVFVGLSGRERAMYLPPIGDLSGRASAFRARKAAMTARLRPLLRCPVDGGALRDGGLSDGGPSGSAASDSAIGVLVCERCDWQGTTSEDGFILAPPGLDADHPGPPYSAHRYDDDARALVAEVGEGLTLDFGSGLRFETFEHVANLDLSAFVSTDLVASCLQVPLVDQCLDGLISVAVLEHLPSPQRAASEIARLVRPGAPVYVAVPFLQPYHGFPSHFFNATRDGLRVLFEETVEIEDIYTPEEGQPISVLTWFLTRYLAGLPEEVAATFRTRAIEEFIGPAAPHFAEDYVESLTPAVVAELSSVNVLRGRRRS